MHLTNKIFFATCAAWLMNESTNIKLSGTKDEIQATKNVLLASKQFQNELKDPKATVDSIAKKLNIKHVNAKEFERILNVPWLF